MTDEQEDHLARLIEDFTAAADKKYRVGQQEHGGNLWDLGAIKLLKESEKEFIDGFVYTHTALELLESLLNDPVIAVRVKELTGKHQ